MRKTLSCAFAAAMLLLGALPARAEIVKSDAGFYLDLPEGYTMPAASADGKYQFVDSTGEAVMSLYAIDGGRYPSAQAILEAITKQLSAKTDGAGMRFQGRDAWYGKIAFMQQGVMDQGYVFCMKGRSGERDYLLLSYADSTQAQGYADFLVSAIDSFSPDAAGLRLPGPAAWSSSPMDGKRDAAASLSYRGGAVPFPAAAGEAALLQAFIEREARVLAAYGDEPAMRDEAWKRYYRLVFRNAYHRLDAPAFALGLEIERRSGAAARLSDREYVEAVLAWVQGFSFHRLGTTSDLMNPIDCALKGDGDCDARALLMAILLQHWNVGACMAVSYEYSHALALVDLPGAKGFNASITAGGKPYLVAETTAAVKPGLIAEDQSDPEKWIGIDFDF